MTSDNPFAPAYSRQSFLETPEGGDALRRLGDGLGAREPFLLVTGDPGTGKTALAYEAIARWGSGVTAAFIAYSALSDVELLEEIVRRFGAEPPDGASRPKLLASLEWALGECAARGQVAIIVVDDAHNLSPELLEELRLLVNAAQQVSRPLEVLLVGTPALEARLEQPALEALRQRVSVRAKLEPLSASETRRYIHHRVAASGGDAPGLFSRKTCRDIATLSRGVPRQINTLATEAMRLARVEGGGTVVQEHVRAAAAALWGIVAMDSMNDSADSGPEDSPAPLAPPRPLAKAAVAAARPAPVVNASRPPSLDASDRVPGPSATPAAPRSAPEAPSAARVEEVAEPSHAPIASQDPREWVARFVGDKGPVMIGSLASLEPNWEAEDFESTESEPPATAEPAPARRGRPAGVHIRSRSSHGGGMRLAIAGALAAIVVVTVVVLVLRANGLARGPAGDASAVESTTTAPLTADKASSSGDVSVRSRGAKASKSAGASTRPANVSSARSRRPYTLDVGEYTDLGSALYQRDRMQELTGFQGWVVSAPEGEARSYRIVLGAYRSYERAQSAANMLLRSKTLPNVTVVPLPPQEARQ